MAVRKGAYTRPAGERKRVDPGALQHSYDQYDRHAAARRGQQETEDAFTEVVPREHHKACPGKTLGVFDGGYALGNVVRPLVKPDEPDQPRIDILTRLRQDARLYKLPPAQ